MDIAARTQLHHLNWYCLTVLLLIACGNQTADQRVTPPSLEQESNYVSAQAAYNNPTTLFITLSAPANSNYFSTYNLSLYDIKASIRIEGAVQHISLFNRNPLSTNDYNPATSVDLASFAVGAKHYIGQFQVPSGVLEAITVSINGAQTLITEQDNPITLVDSFYSTYTPVNNALNHRLFPAETDVLLGNPLPLKGQKTFLNLNIDTDFSLTPDTLKNNNTNQHYALFSPLIHVENITPPFDLSLLSSDLTDLTNDIIGIGLPDQMPFIANIKMKSQSQCLFNGETSNPTSLSGIYFNYLQGQLIDKQGHLHFTLEKCQLIQLKANHDMHLLSGTVDVQDDQMSVLGSKSQLPSTNHYIQPNNQVLNVSAERNNLIDQHVIALESHSNTFLINQYPTVTKRTVTQLDLTGLLVAPQPHLVSFHADKTTLSAELSEPFPCKLLKNNVAPCTGAITELELPLAQPGHYSLQLTRRAAYAEEGSFSHLALLNDKTLHFQNSSEFADTLINKISQEGYRVLRIKADGTTMNNKFIAANQVQLLLFHQQPIIDEQTVLALEEITEADDSADSESGSGTGLYIGIAAAGASVAALTAIFLKYQSKITGALTFTKVNPSTPISKVRRHQIDINSRLAGIQSYWIEQDGNPVEVKQANDGALYTISKGAINQLNKVALTDEDGNFLDGIVLKKIHDEPTAGTDLLFQDKEQRPLQLYKVIKNNVTPITFSSIDAANNSFRSGDIEIQFEANDKNRLKVLKGNQSTFVFAHSEKEAKTKKALPLAELYNRSIDSDLFYMSDQVVFPEQTIKKGSFLSEDDLFFEKAKKHKSKLTLQTDGTYLVTEDFTLEAEKNRQVVLTYLDQQTKVPNDIIPTITNEIDRTILDTGISITRLPNTQALTLNTSQGTQPVSKITFVENGTTKKINFSNTQASLVLNGYTLYFTEKDNQSPKILGNFKEDGSFEASKQLMPIDIFFDDQSITEKFLNAIKHDIQLTTKKKSESTNKHEPNIDLDSYVNLSIDDINHLKQRNQSIEDIDTGAKNRLTDAFNSLGDGLKRLFKK